MGHNATGIPAKLRLSFDAAPSAETRGALGYEIHAFHAQTVPYDAQRFALLLHDAANRLVAGLSGVLSWQWLFVEALWVGDTWRGRGIGRALLTQAEAYAVAAGCHSAWLDTFQARGFYLAIGYQQFGALNDYPRGQIRYFLRKRLVAAMEAPAAWTPREGSDAE
jgi:GNAT superfamily N-acetyltransferase